jgi:hypothetical protein
MLTASSQDPHGLYCIPPTSLKHDGPPWRRTLCKRIINIHRNRPTYHIHQILHSLNLVVHLVFGTSPHLHATASSSAPSTKVLSYPPHPDAFKFLFAHPIFVHCPHFEHIIIFPVAYTQHQAAHEEPRLTTTIGRSWLVHGRWDRGWGNWYEHKTQL